MTISTPTLRLPRSPWPAALGRVAVLVLAMAAAGCANVAKVATGPVLVEDRVTLTLGEAWNQVNIPGRSKPVLWTQDGLPLDALEFWVGYRDGQALAEPGKDKRPLVFKSAMQPHEVVALFEGLYGRDGSTFKLLKLAPQEFLGGPGFRFDFELLRKADDVRALGVAWVAVRNGELFAMTFSAPRLGFYPSHLPKVEQAAASARLK